MLHQFLELHRTEILALAEEKTLKLAGLLPSSEELKRGLPVFYERLIDYLKNPSTEVPEKSLLPGAADHGKELLHLNYTLSHVVHAYGSMCQAITELAQRRNTSITTQEFNDLNLCLDIAIAAAVSEFQYRTVRAKEDREVEHLGFLVHELRNALSSATIAAEMIKHGLVGTSGSTARVLEENLNRMRKLIDRSLSEVRMRADPQLHIEKFHLNILVDQILLTAQSEARSKKQILTNEINLPIELETDRQLLLSAIANLTQNAMKYSKSGGEIFLRAGSTESNVVIEVEDSCGGLSSAQADNLFKPFTSSGIDQSGLGLGLTIVKRAVFLLQGKISVQSSSGNGCAFLIEIPKKMSPISAKKTVGAEKSVQPSSK